MWIYGIQLLDLGEFFQVGFIKRRFRCLVQRDLRAVRFQKALAVSGLTVGIVDWSSFGVVYDVRFQHSNFCQPLLRGFNGIAQFVIVSSSGIHTLLHFFDAADFIFLQKNQGLGHLFQIVAFRPPCIAFAFALGELCLNCCPL